MNKRAKTRFAVSLALICCLAFIFTPYCVRAETDPLQTEGTGQSSSSSAVSDTSSSSEPESQPEEPNETSEPDSVQVTFNFNGGEGSSETIYPPYGTKVGDLATPVKKGYKFAGWSSGGNNIMSSYKITSDITLTAQWEKTETESSKTKSSGRSSSSSGKTVDTHQSEVDAAASDAQAAVSDPDVLSQDDLSGIFSSGSTSSQSSSGTAAGGLTTSSGSTSQGGGSWLFPTGIALIVLAACGIGIFIYLQFFHNTKSTRGIMPDDMDDTEDMDSFTDISSDSSGTQQRAPLGGEDETVAPEPAPAPDAKPETPKIAGHETAPLPDGGAAPSADAPAEKPDEAQRPDSKNLNQKAQAKPVENAKSDFDWDKFFNDDDI